MQTPCSWSLYRLSCKLTELLIYHLITEAVQCKGIYDRKYAELHHDRTCSATTSKKLWEDGEKCGCCASYQQWKVSHPECARDLQAVAGITQYLQGIEINFYWSPIERFCFLCSISSA